MHNFNDFLCAHGNQRDEYTPILGTVGATVHDPQGTEITLGKACLECGNDAETYNTLQLRGKQRLPRSLVIIGRTWFDRAGGNSYCTASVVVDGRLAFQTEREAGYEDHYAQTALEQCVERGILPRPTEARRISWRYVKEDLGIAYHREISEVPRKRDL